jgi:hypothetical protein
MERQVWASACNGLKSSKFRCTKGNKESRQDHRLQERERGLMSANWPRKSEINKEKGLAGQEGVKERAMGESKAAHEGGLCQGRGDEELRRQGREIHRQECEL